MMLLNVLLFFYTHLMLRVNDAEFFWMDEQLEAGEIQAQRCC